MSEPGPRLVFDRCSALPLEPYEAIAPSATPYLVKGLLPRRGVAFLVGAPRSGKTFLALDYALKIACGATVMGRKARQAGVVYVAAEDPDGCRARIEAWKRTHPRGSPTPFMLIGAAVALTDPDALADLVAALREAADRFAGQDLPLGLVVIDTLSRCLAGVEENCSEQMSLAFEALAELGRASGALVLVVAHHGKDAGRGIRGWSGLDAAADATLSVTRDEESGQRSVTLTKIKNGPDGAAVVFSLHPTPLGVFDEDGEEVWSCVVGYDEARPGAASPRRTRALSSHEQIVLGAVLYLTDNGPTQAPPPQALGVPAGALAVRRADASRQARATGLGYDGETAAAYRQRFSRAVAGLAAKQRIRVHGDALWII